MKRSTILPILMGIMAIGMLASCGGGPVGLWQETGEEYSEYRLTLSKQENRFEYVVFSSADAITTYYKGSYEVDKKADTITLSASEQTDCRHEPPPSGESYYSRYHWVESSEVFAFSYEKKGKTLNCNHRQYCSGTCRAGPASGADEGTRGRLSHSSFCYLRLGSGRCAYSC
jgi:hypothetical protein